MSVTIELWKDTGYTESGVERPPIGSVLTSPDLIFDELNPQKGELFSSVQIKAPYTDLYQCSYLRATYDFNESDPLVLYGWIDSVALMSDTTDFPSTRIDWHVDLWRTYCSQAEFKTGTVRRRPVTANIPPQPYPYRYKEFKGWRDIVPNMSGFANEKVWWVYMNFIQEFNNGEDTEIRHICWPVSSGGGAPYIAGGQGWTARQGPTFNDVFTGKVDEVLGLSPSAIIACTISPISPVTMEGTGYLSSDPFYTTNNVWSLLQVGDAYVFEVSRVPTASNFFEEFQAAMQFSHMTDDTDEYLVTGLDGTTLGVLPWGMEVDRYSYRMIDDTTSFYIQIRFLRPNETFYDEVCATTEGLCFTQPLPLLSVTSNSWSDYVYSGQREYDINMRRLQTTQDVVNGLSNAIGMGIQTTQMQQLSNQGVLSKYVNPFSGGLTATGQQFAGTLSRHASMVGLAAGATSMAAGAIQAGAAFAYFNNEYQKWEDYQHAHQIDNIITSGAGTDNIFYGAPIRLVWMSNDEYSIQQRNIDIRLYGAHVTEPTDNCQTLVEVGGPLQITNMTVGGAIPVEAKEYIRAMFSNGVRLV